MAKYPYQRYNLLDPVGNVINGVIDLTQAAAGGLSAAMQAASAAASPLGPSLAKAAKGAGQWAQQAAQWAGQKTQQAGQWSGQKAGAAAQWTGQKAQQAAGAAGQWAGQAAQGAGSWVRGAIKSADQDRRAVTAKGLTDAMRDPISALEKLGESGGRAANAARALASGIRTFQAARGAYSWAYGVMQRGNPNMAGQMSGTMDLVNNRIAGLLSTPIQQVNAGIQGLVDARPGATIGTGVGAAGGGVIGAAIGSFLFPGLGTWAGGAIGATLGGMAGSAVGSYFAGERALPSMAGLPQPSMGDSASSWYDAAMMKTLALGAGTIEAENERRRIALLESQIGLLREISNNTRGTADFR